MPENYFRWDDDFRTGNTTIDEQHFKLVGIINDLIQISYEDVFRKSGQFEHIISQIESYVMVHFKTEETLMIEMGIDERHKTPHVNMHNEFIKNVDTMVQRYRMDHNKKTLNELGEYLIRWLAYHILIIDKLLIRQVEWIKSHGMTPEVAFIETESYVETTTEPLIKALKALFILVSEKNVALEEKNELLERKVKERTQELVALNVKLKEISMTDELTKLPNRRYTMLQLEILFNNWRRYDAVFSLLYIDADRFKEVNDSFGHDVGDRVLQWISVYLKSHVRRSDMVCRLGGDEFVVICEHCDAASALQLKHKLLMNLNHLMPEGTASYWTPSLSIGVVSIDDTSLNPSDFLRKADEAMYEIKKERQQT